MLNPIAGIRAAAVDTAAHYPDRADLTLFEVAAGSTMSVLSTVNTAVAAPVRVLRQHLQQQKPNAPVYWLVNAGNANAATGSAGMQEALRCCAEIARLAEVEPSQVLPFSTGIIGLSLETEVLLAAMPPLYQGLSEDGWPQAAAGILTTDTHPKTASTTCTIQGRQVRLTGCAKGAAMIKPNMATLLAFAATDARIAPDLLDAMHRQATDATFNRICIEGDTSTNDCVALAATGCNPDKVEITAQTRQVFAQALQTLYGDLAAQVVGDAEGATRVVRIAVEGGKSEAECKAAADAVADSVLLKVALSAGDPNWGRVLMALGNSGIPGLDLDTVSLWLGALAVFVKGAPVAGYTEEKGAAELQEGEVLIRLHLGRGDASSHALTCDLTTEYIRLNSEYRT